MAKKDNDILELTLKDLIFEENQFDWNPIKYEPKHTETTLINKNDILILSIEEKKNLLNDLNKLTLDIYKRKYLPISDNIDYICTALQYIKNNKLLSEELEYNIECSPKDFFFKLLSDLYMSIETNAYIKLQEDNLVRDKLVKGHKEDIEYLNLITNFTREDVADINEQKNKGDVKVTLNAIIEKFDRQGFLQYIGIDRGEYTEKGKKIDMPKMIIDFIKMKYCISKSLYLDSQQYKRKYKKQNKEGLSKNKLKGYTLLRRLHKSFNNKSSMTNQNNT